MGFANIADVNDPNAPADGLVSMDLTINNKNQRVSTFHAILPRETALKREKNLAICTSAIVSRVVFSHGEQKPRAEKVVFTSAQPGTSKDFSVKVKREVIICSGAIGSPQVLMLRYPTPSILYSKAKSLTFVIYSGIGPRDHLKSIGVEVVYDLPGVGSNLVRSLLIFTSIWVR